MSRLARGNLHLLGFVSVVVFFCCHDFELSQALDPLLDRWSGSPQRSRVVSNSGGEIYCRLEALLAAPALDNNPGCGIDYRVGSFEGEG
jgi:hypothetical protein